MKFIFTLIVMGYSLLSQCQEIKRYPWEDGTLTEQHYVNNVLKKQKIFYASGNIRSETNFESEVPNHGTYREWYDNGQIKEYRKLNINQEGKAEGWDNDGRLRYKTVYTKDREATKAYFPNGQLSRTYTKKYNRLNGKDTYWYENGRLKQETNYIDGKFNGSNKHWHENGQLRYEGNCIDGKATVITKYGMKRFLLPKDPWIWENFFGKNIMIQEN